MFQLDVCTQYVLTFGRNSKPQGCSEISKFVRIYATDCVHGSHHGALIVNTMHATLLWQQGSLETTDIWSSITAMLISMGDGCSTSPTWHVMLKILLVWLSVHSVGMVHHNGCGSTRVAVCLKTPKHSN
jgi:hypothetical protein